METTANNERSVTRTYRAAIRLGEDFVTLEETIVLPLDASDEEIQQAVELGWRIYRTQREAMEGQVSGVREAYSAAATPFIMRDPDAPASEKQRNYIAALQEELTWNNEQLAGYAGEHGVELVTMTKGQASGFIDNLKKLVEERGQYQAGQRSQSQAAGESSASVEPLTERQHRALLKLAQERSLDLDSETQQRFGVAATGLSSAEASSLLTEWQRGTRSTGSRRSVAEPAL